MCLCEHVYMCSRMYLVPGCSYLLCVTCPCVYMYLCMRMFAQADPWREATGGRPRSQPQVLHLDGVGLGNSQRPTCSVGLGTLELPLCSLQVLLLPEWELGKAGTCAQGPKGHHWAMSVCDCRRGQLHEAGLPAGQMSKRADTPTRLQSQARGSHRQELGSGVWAPMPGLQGQPLASPRCS